MDKKKCKCLVTLYSSCISNNSFVGAKVKIIFNVNYFKEIYCDANLSHLYKFMLFNTRYRLDTRFNSLYNMIFFLSFQKNIRCITSNNSFCTAKVPIISHFTKKSAPTSEHRADFSARYFLSVAEKESSKEIQV